MGLDVLAAPLISKESNDVTTGVKALRTNRYVPSATDTGSQAITSATYAIIHASNGIIDLNGAPGCTMRIIMSDGTSTDKVAVQIWGSVDGTNFFDVWHPMLTGDTSPIINDYGAVSMPLEISTGLRKIAIYAKRTSGVAGTGTVQVMWQPKFDTVAVNQAALFKKFIDSCADLSRGQVGANITNWPSNNVTPINFADTTNVGAATVYYPSSTGMSLAGIKDMTITGKLIAGAADTLTFSIEVLNDEDTAGDWQQIEFIDAMTGFDYNQFVVSNAIQQLCLVMPEYIGSIGKFANVRLKLIVAGGVSNTVILKGNSVGGA